MFKKRLKKTAKQHNKLIVKSNKKLFSTNGVFNRYKNPILTRDHVPLHWRFDLNPETNPNFLERIGFNTAFNSGAIIFGDKYILVVRVERNNRKSFFAVAESANGIDNFKFWDKPITMSRVNDDETNVYDIRLTKHDDGYIYGVFCSEKKDPDAPEGNLSSAIAEAGIARTKNLKDRERLPNLITYSGHQRNVVLFPHLIEGKYAFYIRPQDGFISAGSGGGIGFGLADSIENAETKEEVIVDHRKYHTISEYKNGMDPGPIRTKHEWLNLAHGVRDTAAGLRYTLYMFMSDLEKPWVVSHKPAGHFMAPLQEERVGDVSNVLLTNGWIEDEDGKVFIYYASSDTRTHVATSSVDKLVDYCINSPQDKLHSHLSVETINELINSNKKFMTNLNYDV